MKAIALDMDGTILNNRGEYSPRLVEALTKLHDEGMLIFIATGRTKSGILRVTPKEVPLSGFVAASGMSIYKRADSNYDKIVSYRFDRKLVEEIITSAKEREIYYEAFTAESGGKTLKEDKEYSARDIGGEQPETMFEYEHVQLLKTLNNEEQWVDELNMDEILKVFFISKNIDKIDAWFDYLSDQQKRLDYSLYKTSRHNSEIMLGGKDKGTGLEVLVKEYGLSTEDVHAIGDSMNDLPLFEVCGRKTAMANSTESVISAADDVTEFSNEEDGLAIYLEETYLK
ncbi:HAD family hydrolase [Salinicoccus sp. YB14-2]|uniref:HAD family hydrolase n=1 Tax=Salinicoccus sp. YB14-2 TaxID=1572701 RepID=UPI00068D886C|nr:HAD family hydrolase [Salinicoccus sp. YB14-2]